MFPKSHVASVAVAVPVVLSVTTRPREQLLSKVVRAVCIRARWIIHSPYVRLLLHWTGSVVGVGIYPSPVGQWAPKAVSPQWCIGWKSWIRSWKRVDSDMHARVARSSDV